MPRRKINCGLDKTYANRRFDFNFFAADVCGFL